MPNGAVLSRIDRRLIGAKAFGLDRQGAGMFSTSLDPPKARGSAFVSCRLMPHGAAAPVANAYAERWVGTARRELLDRTLIWNNRQVEQLIREYFEHYNTYRPRRSLRQRAPNETEAVEYRPGLAAATDAKWWAYPDGWKDTTGNGTYEPSQVISIGNGMMDLYLHTANGIHMVSAAVPKILRATVREAE